MLVLCQYIQELSTHRKRKSQIYSINAYGRVSENFSSWEIFVFPKTHNYDLNTVISFCANFILLASFATKFTPYKYFKFDPLSK